MSINFAQLAGFDVNEIAASFDGFMADAVLMSRIHSSPHNQNDLTSGTTTGFEQYNCRTQFTDIIDRRFDETLTEKRDTSIIMLRGSLDRYQEGTEPRIDDLLTTQGAQFLIREVKPFYGLFYIIGLQSAPGVKAVIAPLLPDFTNEFTDEFF